jgi:hypothetical protein
VTVSAQTPINSSTGNGVTTVFPYAFKIIAAADLEVTVDGVVQTLTTHYTVSGAGNEAGGNITFVTAPAAGTTVVRRRNMALVRTVDYQNLGDLRSDVLNQDQDAPILMLQQLADAHQRAITLPLGDATSGELPVADTRAGMLLGFDPVSGAPMLYAQGTSTLGDAVLDQEASNQVFSQNGAKIQRMNDRVMVGAAGESDFAYPNVTKDWLSTFQTDNGFPNGTILSAQAAVLTNEAESAAVGFLSASRSLHFSSVGAACIGLMAVAVNNNPTLGTSAWGLYVEGHRTSALAGTAYGAEFDIRTTVASVSPTPYQQGDTVGLQLACGAEFGGSVNASAAIQIADNPSEFKAGVNFMATALEGTDGSDGSVGVGLAMMMARRHMLAWYASDGTQIGTIRSDTTSGGGKNVGLVFTDNGLQFAGTSGEALGYVFRVNGAVNYPTLVPHTTGNAVQYAVGGTDTHIDLQLTPQGANGRVRFGTWTSNADAAVNGYIAVKDAAGNARKLATIA